MKKRLFSPIALGLLLASTGAFAQEISRQVDSPNGKPYFIEFKNATQKQTSVNSDMLFRNILGISQDSEMKKISSGHLFDKFSDDKFQLYHKNIKVEFATYSLHYIDGTLRSMSGEMYDTANVDTSPKISEASALKSALENLGVKKLMIGVDEVSKNNYSAPKGELVLLPVLLDDDSHRLVLAYKFDVYSEAPLLRSDMYVDAYDGKVLLNNPTMKHVGEIARNQIHTIVSQIPSADIKRSNDIPFPLLVAGNAATRYSGTQSIETTLSGSSYILRDTTRGGGVYTYNNGKSTSLRTTNFTDADNNWTAAEHNNANYDNAALDAHWGVAKTYDYFKLNHNRNSYNNLGTALKSYVHYGSSYENAGWTGSEMIYGDGASTFSPLTAFDVTAHELGHGVCSSSANLTYSRESGALNEGLSDIWGAVVEYTYAPNKSPFLIGEDITKVSPYYLRSMSNPNSGYSAQPDTYGGTYWKAATSSCTPTSSNDNCGVHYNSGVLNYMFYLLVTGGSGTNDIGNSFNVTGIGFADAAKIIYRLETTYLTSSSNYTNAMTYAIQSAKDLFGSDTQQHISTQNAFYAVGLGTPYSASTADTQAPTAPSNLAASGTSTTSTTLSWAASTDNVGVTGYNIYQGTTQVGTSTSTSYTVSNLTAGTSYSFTVRAKDAAGNLSNASNSVSVTTTTASDTTAPTAPTNLAASGTTATSTNLSWTASTDNVAVTGYNVYQGSTLIASPTTTTYSVTGLTASTAYSFSVRAKDAAGNLSAASSTLSVTTSASTGTQTPPTGYCTSKGNNASYERIGTVKFNTINNTTTATTGYEDQTSKTTNVTKGTSYTITITPKWASTTYNEGYAVFIDYNRDGDFADSGETVWTKAASKTTPVSGTIIIPASAADGPTRMRVSMKYTGIPTSCETFSYGQVEDYIVNIGSQTVTSLIDVKASKETTIYPNPVKDMITISTAKDSQYQYQVYSASGQVVQSGSSSGYNVNVAKLPAGSYVIKLTNSEESVSHKFIKK